ncbi:class I SAM-dependent methyltransferase [Kribbella sp. NBC_01245]|uniref:class I SAM-dependent methyltransferase n=1 Tax=Kribbella sp. NBC_01245 TaxID=2903578 RepID=UPI002E2D0B55|nr:class I SAM-dependent methyltransferase [Kribbella sp. NBC_01245]
MSHHQHAAYSTISPDLMEHYSSRWDESARLSSTVKGRLETERLRYFLTRYLPGPNAKVADIGGGPGAHAAWMIEQGHSVGLLDPVPRHIEQARAAGVPALLGDARSLPWHDETYDAVLMAGPMYHLVNKADRLQALSEAVRVLRPGGLLMVVAINRTANLIGSALANTLSRRREVVEDILRTGSSSSNERMAPSTHYHGTTVLRTELTVVGLRPVTLHGLTGPGGWLTVVLDAHRAGPLPPTLLDPDPLTTALECSRLADDQPELVPSSSLLLGVGWRA